MKRFDLLKSSDDKLWLINCTLRKNRLEAGLVIFFGGLPSSISVFHESDLIATVIIPDSLKKVITSAALADVSFELVDQAS